VPCGIVAITTQTWGFSLGLRAEQQERQHRSKEAGNDPQHHDHQPRCPFKFELLLKQLVLQLLLAKRNEDVGIVAVATPQRAAGRGSFSRGSSQRAPTSKSTPKGVRPLRNCRKILFVSQRKWIVVRSCSKRSQTSCV